MSSTDSTADENGRAHVKIGLLGPRGVGKTSLITALIGAGTKRLEGSPVSLTPSSRSRARLERFQAGLRGSLREGTFLAPALEPTKQLDNLEFNLSVDRDPSLGIGFDVMDFPGGWLTMDPRPEAFRSFERHLDQSPILIIPVDATYLMEARSPQVKSSLDLALQVMTVENVVREWSKRRANSPEEPAMLAIAPVKCESYFADNGGRSNESKRLYDLVNQYFGSVVRAAMAEMEKAPQRPSLERVYCPIDTLGSVELEYGRWFTDADDLPAFNGKFKIRGGLDSPRLGAGDLLTRICQYMLEADQRLRAPEHRRLAEKAEKQSKEANEDWGFFGNIWAGLTGKREKLKKSAKESDAAAQEQLEKLQMVDEAIQRLSTTPGEGRLYSWMGR